MKEHGKRFVLTSEKKEGFDNKLLEGLREHLNEEISFESLYEIVKLVKQANKETIGIAHDYMQGHFKEMKEIAEQIEDPYNRSGAQMRIAVAEAEAGDIEAAKVTVEQIEDLYLRSIVQGDIAADEISLGKFSLDDYSESFNDNPEIKLKLLKQKLNLIKSINSIVK